MLQLRYTRKTLPFQYPFELAKGIKTEQPTLLVSLGFRNLKGYGETTEIAYYNASVTEMIACLESKRQAIERYAINSPERFWHFLHHLFPDQHFLIAALDTAGWDLWAKMNGKTVRELMNIPERPLPPTDYTIGFHSDADIKKIVAENPMPCYKLKMGTDQDLTRLKTLHLAAPNARIRLDINESWTWQQAKSILPALAEMNVELIEQPFPRQDLTSLKQLRAETDIPVIADEACVAEADLPRCLPHYDGINIKLSKCGGLTPALRMIGQIKAAEKKVMLGNMCESYIGSTAIAQLLPMADYADIDGPLLLKENFGNGIRYDGARISFPDGPGLGITFG